MERRAVLMAVMAGVAGAPLRLFARDKPWRVGFFYLGSRQSAMETNRYTPFIEGMRELGYEEGKQYVLVARFADSAYERLPAIAAELAAADLDVVVSTATGTHNALKKATTTLPIVSTNMIDPVREGFADTLAHPGRNFTGLSTQFSERLPKNLEFLRMAMPRLSRLAALWTPGNATHTPLLKDLDAVARGESIRVVHVGASTPREIDSGFATMARERVEAFIILGDALFVQQFRQIAEGAAKHHLASIYSAAEYPEFGGLMSYGPSFRENYRRAAVFVDKILKGAKPGDLPFEQPMKFELVINRKTARTIGLPLSQELLLRADRVIE